MGFQRINNCPICTSKEKKEIFTSTLEAFNRFRDLSEKKYRGVMNAWASEVSLNVFCCRTCSHIWHADFPDFDALSLMYKSSKAIDESKRLTVPNDRMHNEMRLLHRLCKPKSRLRLLDYGSGFGMWARAAVQAGFEVVAFEPSLERSTSIGGDFGYQAVNSLDDLVGQVFDAINIEQVLEHIIDPVFTLRSLKQLSKPETVVRVAVPNAVSLLKNPSLMDIFPYDGTSMHLLSPYEHLHGFTPDSWQTLLRKSGLSKVHRTMMKSPKQWLRMMIPNTFAIANFQN
jgi:2-polyprenyl-3-methyl-5-hydroxy-6-metoxy-1,4-benzoquinol methylase